MIYALRKYYLFLLFVPQMFYAQIIINSGTQTNELKGILYKNEFSVEGKLHTGGMTLGFNRCKIVKYYKTNFYHFDIGYLKSQKEKKGNLVSTSLNLYNNYIYGKQNYFFPIRFGKGIRVYLSEKEASRGVAVGYSIEGGLTLGIAKPYYLWIKTSNSENLAILTEVKYREETRDIFLDQNLIYDKVSFWHGLYESKIYTGAHINAALHFGLKAYEKPVYAIETGVMIDAFTRRIPIMVETENFKNNFLFVNVFANIHFGKRWN